MHPVPFAPLPASCSVGLLMPGDEALLQQYISTAIKEEVGPVLRFLPFIAWWRAVIVQDAPLRLQFEPEAQFFKVHPLFRNVLFRAFFNKVLSPTVLASHAEGERKCEEQCKYDPVKALLHQLSHTSEACPGCVPRAQVRPGFPGCMLLNGSALNHSAVRRCVP